MYCGAQCARACITVYKAQLSPDARRPLAVHRALHDNTNCRFDDGALRPSSVLRLSSLHKKRTHFDVCAPVIALLRYGERLFSVHLHPFHSRRVTVVISARVEHCKALHAHCIHSTICTLVPDALSRPRARANGYYLTAPSPMCSWLAWYWDVYARECVACFQPRQLRGGRSL